jgi:hypothetical protein
MRCLGPPLNTIMNFIGCGGNPGAKYSDGDKVCIADLKLVFTEYGINDVQTSDDLINKDNTQVCIKCEEAISDFGALLQGLSTEGVLEKAGSST